MAQSLEVEGPLPPVCDRYYTKYYATGRLHSRILLLLVLLLTVHKYMYITVRPVLWRDEYVTMHNADPRSRK